ncbi:polysaccharide deacetylase family protein [Corallococcus exiguus]|uniref:polysaccharide deacetylase family protein n=1 Tax=Corallococcus exiguus TaxID=83462 RepID=UPI00155F688A|nr:polysaccharide deacetylase family protein [Corallococcus exiguus]
MAGSCKKRESPFGEPLKTDFRAHPLQITAAFDGSKRFGMWLDTLGFARKMKRETGRSIHFSYFINTAYYDPAVKGVAIDPLDVPTTDEEARVRWALTQQAVNEGHEIANHTVRHLSGRTWSDADWRKEIDEFHALVEENLFDPVRDAAGKAVFPKWEPLKTAAPGQVGSRCGSDTDCQSSTCLHLSEDVGVCSTTCNANTPCVAGMVCGSPTWTKATDVCVPPPSFPIQHEDKVLFDAEGHPRRENLQPYRVVGFRAPFLHYNAALYRVLSARGYLYDSSPSWKLGPPRRMTEEPGKGMLQFPLMWLKGTLTYSMDDAYNSKGGTGAQMEADYQKAILAAYEDFGRVPWNMGHHFALLRDGEYWRAMQKTMTYAAAGCPDSQGTRRCQDVEFPSFRELSENKLPRWDGTASNP